MPSTVRASRIHIYIGITAIVLPTILALALTEMIPPLLILYAVSLGICTYFANFLGIDPLILFFAGWAISSLSGSLLTLRFIRNGFAVRSSDQ